MISMVEKAMPGSRMITGKKRILLVDDHPIVIFGLKLLLSDSESVSICGEANDIMSACQKVDDLSPDIVILDLILGEQDGIDLIRTLLRHRQNSSSSFIRAAMSRLRARGPCWRVRGVMFRRSAVCGRSRRRSRR